MDIHGVSATSVRAVMRGQEVHCGSAFLNPLLTGHDACGVHCLTDPQSCMPMAATLAHYLSPVRLHLRPTFQVFEGSGAIHRSTYTVAFTPRVPVAQGKHQREGKEVNDNEAPQSHNKQNRALRQPSKSTQQQRISPEHAMDLAKQGQYLG